MLRSHEESDNDVHVGTSMAARSSQSVRGQGLMRRVYARLGGLNPQMTQVLSLAQSAYVNSERSKKLAVMVSTFILEISCQSKIIMRIRFIGKAPIFITASNEVKHFAVYLSGFMMRVFTSCYFVILKGDKVSVRDVSHSNSHRDFILFQTPGNVRTHSCRLTCNYQAPDYLHHKLYTSISRRPWLFILLN